MKVPKVKRCSREDRGVHPKIWCEAKPQAPTLLEESGKSFEDGLESHSEPGQSVDRRKILSDFFSQSNNG